MSPGSPAPDVDSLPPGTLVGSYEILELIGAGGMGVVYRAKHRAIGRLAAIKVLKAERMGEQGAVDLFGKEAATLGAMSHRNLVEVLDFGQLPNGQPYLTMAYVDGKTLHQLIAESVGGTGSGLSVSTALNVTEQVLNALGEAHKKGIVHRDLKPANVMLLREHTGELLVKVLDFGLARPVEGAVLPWASLPSTKQSSAAGTPAYVSPEQIRNEELDGRADLYSLGCTLYEMLAGQAPFVSESPLELVKQQLDAPPPSLREHVTNLPEEVERLVLWFLQKDREDRPATADVARLEVRRLLTKLSRESTVLRAPSSLPPLRKLSGEHPEPIDAPLPQPSTRPELQPVDERAPAKRYLLWLGGATLVVLLAVAGRVVVGSDPAADESPAVRVRVPAAVSERPAVAPPAAPGPEADDLDTGTAGPAEPATDGRAAQGERGDTGAIAAPAEAAPNGLVAPVGRPDPGPAAGPAGVVADAGAEEELQGLAARPRPVLRKRPVATCTFDADFVAFARKSHQTLQTQAARAGVSQATRDALEDAFGSAMVRENCGEALRTLDKLRRHASSP